MKKVLLSAVMMIAFVGTSMANDVAEREVGIAESKEVVAHSKQVDKTEQSRISVCDELAVLTMSSCNVCNHLSDVAYYRIYRSLVDGCNNSLSAL